MAARTARQPGAMRYAGALLGLVVGGVFLFLTLRSLHWDTVGAALSQARPGWLLVASGLCALAFLLRMERWRQMLASIGSSVRLRDLAAPFLGAFALNNILPLRAGDVVRAAAFRTRIKVPPSGATATLLVERVFDLYAILLLGAVALAASPGVLAGASETFRLGAFGALSLVVGGLTVLLLLPRTFAALGLRIMAHPLGRLIPRKLGRFGVRTLVRISHILRRVGALRMIALSVGAWAIEGGVFLCAILALGLQAEPGAAWLALTAGNLGALLPGPPGHFGTFHFLAANALAGAGPSYDQAVLAAAIGHFLIWILVTTGGLLALLLARESGPNIASPPREAPESGRPAA